MDTLLFFLWSVGSVVVRFLPRVLSVSPSATCIIGFGDLCSDLATKYERRMVMNSCFSQKVQLSLQLQLNFRDLLLSITIIHKKKTIPYQEQEDLRPRQQLPRTLPLSQAEEDHLVIADVRATGAGQESLGAEMFWKKQHCRG